MQKLIDETGNKYGLLTVIHKTKDKNGRTAWMCKCDCGNEKIVRGSDLRTGKITSCGKQCALRFTRNGVAKNEVGNTYGRLTVLKRANYTKNGKIVWTCQCQCGNIVDVRGTDLRNGYTLSCGCFSKNQASERQFKDETGKQYGYLTVLSLVQKSPQAIWLCKCKCGRLKEVKGTYLRNGTTKSCGCLLSWYEEEINDLLNRWNINYSRQVTFPNLKNSQNHYLRFDFGIYNNENQLKGLIEYNGEQHYKSIECWGGESQLKKQQEHDKLKLEYCENNNIPLLILNKEHDMEKELHCFIQKVVGGVWDE